MTKSSLPAVYMDACCFIDLAKPQMGVQTLPRRATHVEYCRKFIEAARAKHVLVYTSTISVVECVKVTDDSISGGPTFDGDRVKALFRGMLMSGKSGVMPVMPTLAITDAARDLRWDHAITCKPMDRLHIATAIAMGCSHFFTTDGRLKVENIKKIRALGLEVCTADSCSNILPDEYRQLKLVPLHGKQQDAAA